MQITPCPAELLANDHLADATGPMLRLVPSITHPSPQATQPAERPAGRTGKGVFTVLAWLGGVSLSYYLFCALGYGLYRILQKAF